MYSIHIIDQKQGIDVLGILEVSLSAVPRDAEIDSEDDKDSVSFYTSVGMEKMEVDDMNLTSQSPLHSRAEQNYMPPLQPGYGIVDCDPQARQEREDYLRKMMEDSDEDEVVVRRSRRLMNMRTVEDGQRYLGIRVSLSEDQAAPQRRPKAQASSTAEGKKPATIFAELERAGDSTPTSGSYSAHHHYSSSKSHHTRDTVSAYAWQCCSCFSHDGMDVYTTLTCPGCQHYRCGNCAVERK